MLALIARSALQLEITTLMGGGVGVGSMFLGRDCLNFPRSICERHALFIHARIVCLCEFSFLFYSILFYSILFYSILFYSILFYSILFYSILFYSILFYSILFYSILFYSILFYSILFYSIILYYYNICCTRCFYV